MFLEAINRPCAVVNMDFANDVLPYEVAIDVRDLISLENVMIEHNLGPNGGLVYCMDFLLQNIDWLTDKIEKLSFNYILFDFPGQASLTFLDNRRNFNSIIRLNCIPIINVFKKFWINLRNKIIGYAVFI